MKLLLKNIRENYSKEEKQEEDNLRNNKLNTLFILNKEKNDILIITPNLTSAENSSAFMFPIHI